MLRISPCRVMSVPASDLRATETVSPVHGVYRRRTVYGSSSIQDNIFK